MVPYWSLETFLVWTWMFGFSLFHRATTWSMPGTVFQYWRVTLPVAGAQDDDDAVFDGADEEQAVSRAALVAAAMATPARRARVGEIRIFAFQRPADDSRVDVDTSGRGPDAFWLVRAGATASIRAPSLAAGVTKSYFLIPRNEVPERNRAATAPREAVPTASARTCCRAPGAPLRRRRRRRGSWTGRIAQGASTAGRGRRARRPATRRGPPRRSAPRTARRRPPRRCRAGSRSPRSPAPEHAPHRSQSRAPRNARL